MMSGQHDEEDLKIDQGLELIVDNPKKALALFTEAVSLAVGDNRDPSHIVYFALGILYAEERKFQEAKECLLFGMLLDKDYEIFNIEVPAHNNTQIALKFLAKNALSLCQQYEEAEEKKEEALPSADKSSEQEILQKRYAEYTLNIWLFNYKHDDKCADDSYAPTHNDYATLKFYYEERLKIGEQLANFGFVIVNDEVSIDALNRQLHGEQLSVKQPQAARTSKRKTHRAKRKKAGIKTSPTSHAKKDKRKNKKMERIAKAKAREVKITQQEEAKAAAAEQERMEKERQHKELMEKETADEQRKIEEAQKKKELAEKDAADQNAKGQQRTIEEEQPQKETGKQAAETAVETVSSPSISSSAITVANFTAQHIKGKTTHSTSRIAAILAEQQLLLQNINTQQEQINSKELHFALLAEQVNAQEQRLGSLTAQVNAQQQRLASLTAHVSTKKQHLASLENEIKIKTHELKELENKRYLPLLLPRKIKKSSPSSTQQQNVVASTPPVSIAPVGSLPLPASLSSSVPHATMLWTPQPQVVIMAQIRTPPPIVFFRRP